MAQSEMRVLFQALGHVALLRHVVVQYLPAQERSANNRIIERRIAMRFIPRILLSALLAVSLAAADSYKFVTPKGDVFEITTTGGTLLVEQPTQPTPVPVPPPVPATKMPLYVNLPWPDDWNGSARVKLTVDVMKTARCIKGTIDESTGWPVTESTWRVLTVTNILEAGSTNGAKYPAIAGTYLLRCTSKGTITLNASGATVKNVVTITNATTKETTTTADIVVGGNTQDVDLSFGGPISNAVLIRPGYNFDTIKDQYDSTGALVKRAQVFTTELKNALAPFAGVRLMDTTYTNWADAVDAARRLSVLGADGKMDWSERGNPELATWNGERDGQIKRGIPIEYAITLANELKTDLWLNIPWCATDDYIRNLAMLIKSKLDPALRVRIEWANELWNYAGGFYHSTLFRNESVAFANAYTGSTTKANPAYLANPPYNEYYYSARYAVKRTFDASDIFRSVFGNLDRTQFVLCSQFASPSFIADALNWALRSYPNPPKYYVAAIACAPYYGADLNKPESSTAANILAKLNTTITNRTTGANNEYALELWRSIADANELVLFMYEAGCDLGQGTTNLAARVAVTQDPQMRSTTKAYIDSNYIGAGAQLLCYFHGVCSRDKWGPAWGLTDDVSDLTQPMYLGAVDFTTQAPTPNNGVKVQWYKDGNFTTLLATTTVPLVKHRWQNWQTGETYARATTVGTEAHDCSIRFVGKYWPKSGVTALQAECEASDVASLAYSGPFVINTPIPFEIKYKPTFAGNGTASLRLYEVDSAGVKTVVPQSRLTP